jgi:hypothetical protein
MAVIVSLPRQAGGAAAKKTIVLAGAPCAWTSTFARAAVAGAVPAAVVSVATVPVTRVEVELEMRVPPEVCQLMTSCTPDAYGTLHASHADTL